MSLPSCCSSTNRSNQTVSMDAMLSQRTVSGRVVADSEISSEPDHRSPAEPAGDFRREASRRAFGADDAQGRMPSDWMISSNPTNHYEGRSFQCNRWQDCSITGGSKGLFSSAGLDYIEWQN